MKITYSVVLLMLFSVSRGQVTSEHRIETELDKDIVEFRMVSMGKYGAIQFIHKEKEKGRGKILAISEYDADLKENGYREYEMDENMVYKDHHIHKSILNVLFKERKKGTFAIYRYEMGKGVVKNIEGSMHPKSILTDFITNAETGYIGLKVKKEHMLVRVDLNSGRQKIIPFQKEPGLGYPEIQEMFVSESNDLINVVLLKGLRENPLVQLNRYNSTDLIEQVDIKVKDRSILSAAITDVEGEESIVSGTYGLFRKRESNGMFISGIKEGRQSFIKFYPFSDFDMAFEHLKKSKREKMEKKKQRKDEKNKELNLSFRISLHEIMVVNNEYVVIAECYFPTYRQESYPVTDPQTGMTRYETRTVFDGYQYSHAIVAGFDKSGNKLWDQTLEMWLTYKVFKPTKFIQVSLHNDIVRLLYVSRSKIVAKQIKSGVQLEEEESEIELPEQLSEELKFSRNNRLEHWYDSYFLAWGAQKILNTTDKSKERRRKVYFVEKWKYN